MILRKPYAFIIKHFRIIHLSLLACFIFVFTCTNDIYNLFVNLERTKTYIYAGAGIYINDDVYIFIGIALFLSGVVYWLLREKKKPTKIYLFMIIYLFALAIVFIYMFSQLTIIQENLFDIDKLILMKDISFMSTVPCYFFFIVCFLRGIGFNIKQFNFSKDIEELKIAEKDSAEFEVLIGQNNYKYARAIRRTIRETKYYIKENAFLITIVSIILLLILSGLGYYYYSKYYKRLGNEDITSVNGITYKVNKAYITSRDFNGEIVKDGYKYVVVNLTIYNGLSVATSLDLDRITLLNGDLIYSPTLSYNGKFYDLGYPYGKDEVLQPQTGYEYTLTFEIPYASTGNNFTLRIYYGIENGLSNVVGKYRKFAVRAVNIDSDFSYLNKSINEYINTNVEGVNQFDLMITGFTIKDSYDNKYVRCTSLSECTIMSNVISSTKNSLNTMLILDYKANVYEDANFYKKFNTLNKIIENYAYIGYENETSEYYGKVRLVTKEDVENKVFINIDRKIVNAKKIYIDFCFRNETYTVVLKDDYYKESEETIIE